MCWRLVWTKNKNMGFEYVVILMFQTSVRSLNKIRWRPSGATSRFHIPIIGWLVRHMDLVTFTLGWIVACDSYFQYRYFVTGIVVLLCFVTSVRELINSINILMPHRHFYSFARLDYPCPGSDLQKTLKNKHHIIIYKPQLHERMKSSKAIINIFIIIHKSFQINYGKWFRTCLVSLLISQIFALLLKGPETLWRVEGQCLYHHIR